MDFGKSTFIAEATELLQELDVALITLENNPHDSGAIEYVFRIMHTLKGNSKMFDFQKISEAVHDLETLYEAVRNGQQSVNKPLLDCSFEALDHIKALLTDSSFSNPENQKRHTQLIAKITALCGTGTLEETASSLVQSTTTYHIFFRPHSSHFHDGSNPLYLIEELAELGRILSIPHFQKVEPLQNLDPTNCYTYWDIILETNAPLQNLKDAFVFAEGNSEIAINSIPCSGLIEHRKFVQFVFSTKYEDTRIPTEKIIEMADELGLTQHVSENESPKNDKVITSVRVGSEKLEELMNLVSELITTQARLSLLAEQSKNHELDSISEVVEKLSRRLRDVSFGMTLIPINHLFNRFQRMVRDIASELGKEVKLVSFGGDTELDKSIIESLSDPIMHIIRNSIDHGIEKPKTRESKGKPASGKINLKAYYSGVFVYIEIQDDGSGIDPARIRKKAIEKGVISADAQLSNQEALNLIFHPGLSTAEQITDLSGRGVGMDVVKKGIANLRGSVSIDSQIGKGTKITIKLPLTLSIIDGLLVSVGSDRYIIPLSIVEKCYEIENTKLLNNFNELLTLDKIQFPFINLREQFDQETLTDGTSQIVLVKNNEQHIALALDHIIGEYQAVVKPLGKYFQQQDFVSGATILGDGSIALILDAGKLVEKYLQQTLKEETLTTNHQISQI